MKLEAMNEVLNGNYRLRKGVPDARYSGNYTLYKMIEDGFQVPGTYGRAIETFKTIKAASEYADKHGLLK